MGGMGDLAGKECFPPNPLVIEFFFPDIQRPRCKIFFPESYATKDIFLSVGIFFRQV